MLELVVKNYNPGPVTLHVPCDYPGCDIMTGGRGHIPECSQDWRDLILSF